MRAAGEKRRAEQPAFAERIRVQFGDVEDRARSQPETRENINQVTRRRDGDVGQPNHRRGHPVPVAQVTFGLAAVVMMITRFPYSFAISTAGAGTRKNEKYEAA